MTRDTIWTQLQESHSRQMKMLKTQDTILKALHTLVKLNSNGPAQDPILHHRSCACYVSVHRFGGDALNHLPLRHFGSTRGSCSSDPPAAHLNSSGPPSLPKARFQRFIPGPRVSSDLSPVCVFPATYSRSVSADSDSVVVTVSCSLLGFESPARLQIPALPSGPVVVPGCTIVYVMNKQPV